MGRLCGAWLPCLLLIAAFTATHAVPADSKGQFSPQPSPWDSDFKVARKLFDEGRFAASESSYRIILSQIRATKNSSQQSIYQQARVLTSIAGCQLGQFSYRRSLTTLLEAEQLAEQVQFPHLSGAISGNLASIYSQINSFPEAIEQADLAIRQFRIAGEPSYLIRALEVKGELLSQRRDLAESRAIYREAISLAQNSKDIGSEAFAWSRLGEVLSEGGEYAEAELALNKALHLQEGLRDDARWITLLDLAVLKRRQGKPQLALQMLDAALANPGPAIATIPGYEIPHYRGQMLVDVGRDEEALKVLWDATVKADQWRASALPGDVSSSATVAYLHGVYSDYVNNAARVAVQHRDAALQRRSLDVLAGSRAANLREQAALSLVQQGRLPEEYFTLLKKIQAAEAAWILSPGLADETQMSHWRGQLASIQDQTGIRSALFSKDGEKNSHQKTLRDIQQSLGSEDAVLSFSLGGSTVDSSYLWATTRNAVHLYALPSRQSIEKATGAFRRAVRLGQGSDAAGQALSRMLFQQLGADIWGKRRWLVVPDGVLLDCVPWAALPELGANAVTPIVQNRSIRSLPSEYLLLAKSSTPLIKTFLALGDPVYNRADARFRPVRMVGPADQTVAQLAKIVALARLAGSRLEVESAARIWSAAPAQLLMGADASLARLRFALEQRPDMIHFAVHVLSPDGHPDRAALALSIDEQGVPELLTPEMIATFRVPGSLVVLSGCASQKGTVVPGAGLIGLSRAWLLAGASGVIVSAWPTPDDSGRFFEAFYGYLKGQNGHAGTVVERASIALQLAQLEMRRETGYRRTPSFWAAYSLISKE
jgi:tetratricopeptide (TPR) repeat protein